MPLKILEIKKKNEIAKLRAFTIAKEGNVPKVSLKVGCRCGSTWSS